MSTGNKGSGTPRLPPPIYAAAAAQSLTLLGALRLLESESDWIWVALLAAAAIALPSALLLTGIRPTGHRLGAALLTVGVFLFGILSSDLRGSLLIVTALIPLLVVLVLPRSRLRSWPSLLKRGITIGVVGSLLIASAVYVPYPFGWLIVAAPWIGTIGSRNGSERLLVGPILIGLAYGIGLIFAGPFSVAASVSGCCGVVALGALALLRRSEALPAGPPYRR